MKEFIKLVEDMRTQQKLFFTSDKNSKERQDALDESKRLERQVDKYIKKYHENDSQLNLIEP